MWSEVFSLALEFLDELLVPPCRLPVRGHGVVLEYVNPRLTQVNRSPPTQPAVAGRLVSFSQFFGFKMQGSNSVIGGTTVLPHRLSPSLFMQNGFPIQINDGIACTRID